MGFVLRLPTAGAGALPTLGDIGYISKQNLKGLYLIDGGSGLTESSGGGASALSLLSGSGIPAYAGGVLQMRAAAAQALSTGQTIAGANCTIIIAAKRVTETGPQVLFGHGTQGLGSPMAILDQTTGQLWGTAAPTRPTVAYTASNAWRVWTAVRSATAAALSLNGQTPISVNYAATDPGTTTTANPVTIGSDPAGRPIDADVGFFAVYDRALSAAEIASTYKAIKRVMAAKGIVV